MIRVVSTDMQTSLLDKTIKELSKLMELINDDEKLAFSLKTRLDKIHGGCWQCIIGTDFASATSSLEGNYLFAHILLKNILGPHANRKLLLYRTVSL